MFGFVPLSVNSRKLVRPLTPNCKDRIKQFLNSFFNSLYFFGKIDGVVVVSVIIVTTLLVVYCIVDLKCPDNAVKMAKFSVTKKL